MGELRDCKICKRSVLELQGQFEMLAPYMAKTAEDPDAFALAGEVHSKCLVDSPHGGRWARWTIQHFSEVRRYRLGATVDGWTVLGFARTADAMAVHERGATVGIEPGYGKLKKAAGGHRLPVTVSEAHISFGDREFVRDVQERLARDKSVPLSVLVDHLGIRDDLFWPGVLDKGAWVFSRRLRGDWSPTQVSAEFHYDVWIPEAVAIAWNEVTQGAIKLK